MHGCRFRLGELLLAVAFVGAFAAAARTWAAEWLILIGAFPLAYVLLLAFLVLAIALRQHGDRRRGIRRDDP